MPRYLTVREVRVRIQQPGLRTKAIVVVSALLDPKRYPKEDLAELYRARWNNERDLRSIESTMQIDVLRCMMLELVRKEVWTHLLAYNLIRTVMSQAAARHRIELRCLSCKRAL